MPPTQRAPPQTGKKVKKKVKSKQSEKETTNGTTINKYRTENEFGIH